MDIVAVLERIDQRLAALGISAERASLDSDLHRDAIRNLRRAPARKSRGGGGGNALTISSLARGLRTNVQWLMEGIGDPDDSSEPDDAENLRLLFLELSEDDQELALAFVKRLARRRASGPDREPGDDPLE